MNKQVEQVEGLMTQKSPTSFEVGLFQTFGGAGGI